MKILVVQLLRLGDILMSAPAISSLRKKYPDAELHVLAFSQFKHVASVLDPKIQWHWLDRTGLQNSIGDAAKPLFLAEAQLRIALTPLRNRFDLVCNLTQTRMSGWILKYLNAKESLGLSFDEEGRAQFGNEWFLELNSANGRVRHFVDVWRFGVAANSASAEWQFRRTPILLPERPYICLQTLSSDPKKDYPADKWRQFIRLFNKSYSDHDLVILAAPNEEARLNAAFGSVENARVHACDLPEALAYMDHARALITVDTSLKHLANASPVPVLEISLGSSDPRKTGVYKERSRILATTVSCSPCPHSGPCARATHECSEQISPESIFAELQSLLGNNFSSERALSEPNLPYELHLLEVP